MKKNTWKKLMSLALGAMMMLSLLSSDLLSSLSKDLTVLSKPLIVLNAALIILMVQATTLPYG